MHRASLSVSPAPHSTTKRFYLLAWAARPNEAVPLARARDVLEASELLLLGGVRRTLPFPPPGGPERDAPGMLLAVGPRGSRYVVGEVDWPEGRRPTGAELWRTFSVREIGQFHELWAHLLRQE